MQVILRTLKIVLFASVLVASAADGAWAQKTRLLRFESTPPGAAVFLDNTKGEPICITPARRIRVPYGYHEFIFELEGHRTERVKMNVGSRSYKVKTAMAPLAKLVVTDGSPTALRASVWVDGKKVGEVPWTGWIEPGRRNIEVRRKGYATFSQWIEVTSNQVFTLPVVLGSSAGPAGSLFVTADIGGAPVYVDGRLEGNTPVLIELSAGTVLVEIHAEGLPVWRKTTEVKAGEKTIVDAVIQPNAGPQGTALVLSNVPGTEVVIDGTPVGTAPVTRDKLAVGTHIVEGRVEGYAPVQSTVQVTEGQQTVVKLELRASQAEYGSISVRATVPGARVFIDGGEQGLAPVEMPQIPLGPHAVIVRAPGYADFEATCDVKRNEMCKVMARQEALARLRVVTSTFVPDAVVLIDGDAVGPVPYEGNVTAAEHTIRVEAPHYRPSEQRLKLEPSSTARVLEFRMSQAGTSPEAIAARADAARRARLAAFDRASVISGVPPAPGSNAIDVQFGVPYIIQGRAIVGIIEHLAVGVAARVMERDLEFGMIELGVRGHTGFRVAQALSVGGNLEIFGGTDFEDKNTFGSMATGAATLHFSDKAHFSLTAGLELVWDRWNDTAFISNRKPDSDAEVDAVKTACGAGGSNPLCDGNQTTIRLHIGGHGVVWLSEKMGLTASLTYKAIGATVGSTLDDNPGISRTTREGDRALFRENWFGVADSDPRTYASIGILFRL